MVCQLALCSVLSFHFFIFSVQLETNLQTEERAHRALQMWRQTAGRNANVEHIRQALLVINRKDLIDELYAWIAEKNDFGECFPFKWEFIKHFMYN